MPRSRPVLLVLALAMLVPAATVTAAAPTVSPAEPASASVFVVREVPNSTNYLDVEQESVQRGEHGNASLDVGAALTQETVRLGADLDRRSFANAYRDAPNESARTALLGREVDHLSHRIDAIERQQQRAIDRYNAGELTAEEFLRELATVDVAARQVAARFQHLRDLAGFALSEDLDQRMDALETRLVPLRGPVRSRVGAATTGQGPATTAYALTSPNAVVLGTTDGTQFYREAHLPDERAPSDPDQFATDEDPSGITAASDRARELYPWGYADAGPSLQRIPGTSVYRVRLDHSQGLLETYLDGATRNVFREVQTLRVDRIPTSTTTNRTAALALHLNRTYGTGPMAVTVVDPTTGTPVDATVRVNGQRVGTTGDDGTLWTVTPHRQVRIVAVDGNDTVRASFFAN